MNFLILLFFATSAGASQTLQDEPLNNLLPPSYVLPLPREAVAPPRPEGANFYDTIFTKELSQEFINRYREAFGRTDTEPADGPTQIQEDERRREFGEYMGARLAEYHADLILKNDPHLRQLQQVKETMTHLQFAVASETHFDLRYILSSDLLEGILRNPLADLSVRMNPKNSWITPSRSKEVMATLKRRMTQAIALETNYGLYGKTLEIILSKTLTTHVSTNISQKWRLENTGLGPAEQLTLLGLQASY